MISMEKAKPKIWVVVSVLFGLFFSVVLEMLSKPRIFHDAKAEIIKGHAITISCQSVNGTAPVTYHLIKDTNVFLDRMVTSNDPAAFTDEPIEDVEYQCMANNCHSHPQLYSETLRVKVIGKQEGQGFNRLEGLMSIRGCGDNRDGTCVSHTANQSRTKPPQTALRKTGALGMAIVIPFDLSSDP